MSIKQCARVLIAATFLLTAVAASAEEFSFEVTNTTRSTIRKILVSEDGRSYGFFDIGRGIKPGETVELTWDESTNGESCEQYVKAVFADGSESEPAKFDFCESELALEF